MTLPLTMAIVALVATLRAGATLLSVLDSGGFWLAFGVSAAIAIAVIEHLWYEANAAGGDT